MDQETEKRLIEVRGTAVRLLRSFGDDAFGRLKSVYTYKRRIIAGQKNLPEGLLETADRLHAKLLAEYPILDRNTRNEIMAALLYLVHTTDVVPDNEKEHGYDDDKLFLDDVCRRLGL